MITSSDNFLLIKFHSDVGYEFSGFEILYEAGEMIFATSHENQAIKIGCFIKKFNNFVLQDFDYLSLLF